MNVPLEKQLQFAKWLEFHREECNLGDILKRILSGDFSDVEWFWKDGRKEVSRDA